MSDTVKIIECPRDAWQGLKGQIPTETKAKYLQELVNSGFKHIDAVSFVSPRAVPQMADSEDVLKQLDPPDDVEIIGIVVNEKGADRAIATDAVRTLGFPYSLSPTFLKNNQNQTLEENADILEKVVEKSRNADLGIVVYISMAFGNPYGDLWSVDEVLEAVGLLADDGITEISLADTVGLATPQQIADLCGPVREKFDYVELGVHLHSRHVDAKDKVLAAYDAGIRRFDCAIAGLGGCPFAQDVLVGNMPTESVLSALEERKVVVPIHKPIDALIKMSQDFAVRFGGAAH
ncbi:MAG TPA: hydroxymethylglutaryl-CoA lyase [Candidatus Koribacter sp.]|jgi:hydroxymethylglutaryl-CoA lyase